MNVEDPNNFIYLNRDGNWDTFSWFGLELRSGGELSLHTLPRLIEKADLDLGKLATPSGNAGLAVSADGTLYVSDPEGNRVLVFSGCDRTIPPHPLPCTVLPSEGGPGTFDHPRGLAILAHRTRLVIADSGNDRLQFYDTDAERIAGIDDDFDSPVALATDTHGNLYVVDGSPGRVQKFNAVGDAVPSFTANASAAGVTEATEVAAALVEGDVHVFVLSRDATGEWRVIVLDADGNLRFDSHGAGVTFGATELKQPMGLAATADTVYVGDNSLRRILVFARDTIRNPGSYVFAGEAVDFKGPVAALAIDTDGDLIVHPGIATSPLTLVSTAGHSRQGALWSAATQARDFEVQWHRVKAEARVEDGASLRLFFHRSNDPLDEPAVDPTLANPFSDPSWLPHVLPDDHPAGLRDLYIGGDPAKFIWIGVLFNGPGTVSPILSQLRLEFDQPTYLDHLPAIYRETATCGDFLRRLLVLIETFFEEREEHISSLPKLFDPEAIESRFLPWLATWLALDFDQNWNEAKQREVIARAFERYGRRGTLRGLREAIRVYAGVDVIIEEPIANAAWWALPAPRESCEAKDEFPGDCGETQWVGTADSVLGVTTMLAAVHPQGAVLGSTATLDHSHLITDEEFGAPLFDEVAHRFSVQVYAGQVKCEGAMDRVLDVIEREKPAHTAYHLCVIEPATRVGFQSRIGKDTVVGGGKLPGHLDKNLILGQDSVLGGEPAGLIGERALVGRSTRVG